jgi:hypothetical protein
MLSAHAGVAIAVVAVVAASVGIFLFGVIPAISTTSSASQTTTNTVLNHSTSSHTGTTGTVISGTNDTLSEIGSPPKIHILFGAPQSGNITENIPANTLLWTSWILNSTTQIGGVQTSVVVPPSGINSTVTCAIFIDGRLAGNSTDHIGPVYGLDGVSLSDKSQSVNIFVGIPSNETQPAGTIISMAVYSPTSIAPRFTSGLGVATSEASLGLGSSLPLQLPPATSSIASTMQIWAYYETQ